MKLNSMRKASKKPLFVCSSSTLLGHFVSFPRERAKRDRRDSRGEEIEIQRRRKKISEWQCRYRRHTNMPPFPACCKYCRSLPPPHHSLKGLCHMQIRKVRLYELAHSRGLLDQCNLIHCILHVKLFKGYCKNINRKSWSEKSHLWAMQTAKAMITLRICTVWSGPLLFVLPIRDLFLRWKPFDKLVAVKLSYINTRWCCSNWS